MKQSNITSLTVNRKGNLETDVESYQNSVEALVDEFLARNIDTGRVSCAELVLDLFGEDSHMAVDEIEDMKRSMMMLFAFVARPEIAAQLKKLATGYGEDTYPVHLQRLLWFLDRAGNSLASAEITKAQLSIGVIHDLAYLERVHEEYSRLLQSDKVK